MNKRYKQKDQLYVDNDKKKQDNAKRRQRKQAILAKRYY